MHFIGDSDPAETIAAESVRDTVIKVVRELGHPALADTFARLGQEPPRADEISNDDHADPDAPAVGPPDRHCRTAGVAGAEHDRTNVYPPEIVAAERRGLLTLCDREAPYELAGIVLEPRPPEAASGGGGIVEAIQAAREIVGQYVAIDSPDQLLAAARSDRDAIRAWVRELRIGLRLTGLRSAVNLNCATPPASRAAPPGPLFGAVGANPGARPYADVADALLDELLSSDPGSTRIDWHLCQWDIEPRQRDRLVRVARWALNGAPIAFVSDRPRRPVALAEGLDRDQPAALSVVGLRLDGLAAHLAQIGAIGLDLESYCTRLAGLVSLAISAGRARLRFLRRAARASLVAGFRLDRARLVLVPMGLRDAIRAVTAGVADEAESVRTVLRAILGALARMPAAPVSVILDSAPLRGMASIGLEEDSLAPATLPPPRLQIRQAAAWQSDVGTGTAYISLPADPPLAPSELAELVEFAYQNAGLVRFQFIRSKEVACETPAAR